MSRWVMPNGESASSTACTMHGVAATSPAENAYLGTLKTVKTVCAWQMRLSALVLNSSVSRTYCT